MSGQTIDSKLLERLGIADVCYQKVTELSGGQQQRVSIARVLSKQPRLIFADEPTGNLDSKTGEEVMGFIRELWRKGVTIVLVTHEPVVAKFSQRIIHLRDGKIEFEEESSKLSKHYLKVK